MAFLSPDNRIDSAKRWCATSQHGHRLPASLMLARSMRTFHWTSISRLLDAIALLDGKNGRVEEITALFFSPDTKGCNARSLFLKTTKKSVSATETIIFAFFIHDAKKFCGFWYISACDFYGVSSCFSLWDGLGSRKKVGLRGAFEHDVFFSRDKNWWTVAWFFFSLFLCHYCIYHSCFFSPLLLRFQHSTLVSVGLF